MMNIVFHISQLLYRYQCVSIPGFGAFLTETLSANIQESNQTFYPPKKIISFNPKLINNDGLLANHISIVEKISYSQAVLHIENTVFNWKKDLEITNFLLLKNIGEFRLNHEKNIVFTPSNHVNYLTTSFGLSTFIAPVMQREAIFVKPAIELEKKDLFLIEKIEVEESRNHLSPFLKYAAVFLISASVFGVSYKTYLINQETNETNLAQAYVQKEVQAKIQEATFVIENPIPRVLKTNNHIKLDYHIMAGAFRNMENATKELEKLKFIGYTDAKIISKNKYGLIPVIYKSFSTYEEAQKEKTTIQKTKNKEAWILLQEL